MEPLTAITVIATKYGVAGLIGALTGEQTLGGLASELVNALAASEDRLGERLAGIERRLDEVLEQQYKTALGTGLRTLLDAGTTTGVRVRADELVRARDLFREAAASARTTLQAAVAERYLALCAIGLGREDAARTALGRLNVAAFEALAAAAEPAGPKVRQHAQAQLEGMSWFRREEQINELTASVAWAASRAAKLAGSLLHEAGVLAEGLGDDNLPQLTTLPEKSAAMHGVVDHPLDRWEIRPRGSDPARFGPFTVTWHRVQTRAEAEPPTPAVPLLDRRLPDRVVDVDLTVLVEPVLSKPVDLTLNTTSSLAPADPYASWQLEHERKRLLPAGEREIRIQCEITGTYEPTLNVGGVLLFRPSATPQ